MTHPDDIPTPDHEDPGFRTALALLDLREVIDRQREVIDLLTRGYRSHHAAILDDAEQIDDLRQRVETLEASHG